MMELVVSDNSALPLDWELRPWPGMTMFGWSFYYQRRVARAVPAACNSLTVFSAFLFLPVAFMMWPGEDIV